MANISSKASSIDQHSIFSNDFYTSTPPIVNMKPSLKSRVHMGGWGLFISWALFIGIIQPIGNNYDNARFYLIDIIVPALVVLGLTIIAQKMLSYRILLIIFQTVTIVVLFWMGYVANSFEIYNGDNIMFIGGHFIIYHEYLTQIFFAALFPTMYLQSVLLLETLSDTNEKQKIHFNSIYRVILVEVMQILGFLVVIKYLSLGMGFYLWAFILGIGSIINTQSPGSDLQHKTTSEDPKTPKLTVILKIIALFLFNLLAGFYWTIDFMRYGTDAEGSAYTLFFELNPRGVLDEAMRMLIFLLIALFLGKTYLKRLWLKSINSPKQKTYTLGVFLGLAWLLYILQNFGFNLYLIRASSVFLPWIYITIFVWVIIPLARNRRGNTIRYAVTCFLCIFANWGGMVLANDPDELHAGWVMGLILGLISILGIAAEIYENKREISPKTAQDSATVRMNPFWAKFQQVHKTSTEIHCKIVELSRNKKLIPTVYLSILILAPIGFTAYHASSSDNFQILANVDNNCLFYLADPLTRIDQDYKPNLGLSRYRDINSTISISSARNEYESVQVVMLPINQRHFSLYDLTFSGFSHTSGLSIINNSNFKAYNLEYIEGLSEVVADRLSPFRSLTVADGKNHPFWLTFYVPDNAIAGQYTGQITLNVDEKWDPLDWYRSQDITINVELEVFNFTLPKAPSLKSNFGIRDDDYLEEWWHKFPEYRMMRWSILKAPNCTLSTDGTINSIDFLAFNDTVMENFHYHTHSLGIHSSDFAYILPEGDFLVNSITYNRSTYRESEHYNSTLSEYFDLFETYLKNQWFIDESGKNVTWFEEFYISGHDEIQGRGEEVTREALEEYRWLKNDIGMTLPIMQTGAEPKREPLMYDLIDIICFHSTGKEPDYITDWKSRGKEVWFYTTRGPRFPAPSASTSGMATQLRALAWQCYVFNYSNYLIWDIKTPNNGRSGYGYQGWNGGTLLYPTAEGYLLSARMENIRDGFEDYEYFYLLERYLEEGEGGGSANEITALQLQVDIDMLFVKGFSPNMDYRQVQNLRVRIGRFVATI